MKLLILKQIKWNGTYAGDEVFITASHESIRKAAKFMGIRKKIKI